MPNDPGGEPYDGRDDIWAHQRLEYPSDKVRVQHVASPISYLVEERGWPVGCTGHGQLDVAAKVTPIE